MRASAKSSRRLLTELIGDIITDINSQRVTQARRKSEHRAVRELLRREGESVSDEIVEEILGA